MCSAVLKSCIIKGNSYKNHPFVDDDWPGVAAAAAAATGRDGDGPRLLELSAA